MKKEAQKEPHLVHINWCKITNSNLNILSPHLETNCMPLGNEEMQ